VSSPERVAGSVRVSIGGRTDVGRQRSENQDCFLVADLCGEGEADVHQGSGSHADALTVDVGDRGVIAIVADGMGGAAAGALASRLAAEEIYREVVGRWCTDPDASSQRFVQRLREALEWANGFVHQQALVHEAYQGMGTTATVAGVLQGVLYLAHVGDSRAYLVREEQAYQMTRDQSLVQELVDAGRMTEEEAERSPHASVLLQALGTKPRVEVDLVSLELCCGDTVVLCSDGLFRVVRKEEFAALLARSASAETLCDALVDLANERGAPDNVTVVVLGFDGPSLPWPESANARRQETCASPHA
jgi:serine/threonine protein phosphatase PrpC